MNTSPQLVFSIKSFVGSIAFAFYLCGVYIGDFSIDDANVSPFLLGVVIAVFLVISRPKVVAVSSLIWIIFCSFLLAITMKVNQNEYYFVSFSIALFTLVYFLVKPLVRPSSIIVVASTAILLLTTALLISAGGSLGSRTTILFGPNILYRVIATFIALALFTPCERSSFVRILTLIGVLVGSYGILLTGSRGAILELLFILIIWVLQTNGRIFWASCAAGLLLALLVVGTSFDTPLADIRIFKFSSNLESISVRLDAFSSVHSFFDLPVGQVLFGYHDFKTLTYIMPHNILLEGLLAFGAFFAFLLAVGFTSYFLHFARRIRDPNSWWFDIPILTTFVGSQVSGTYAHNYSAITLALIGNIFLAKFFLASSKSIPNRTEIRTARIRSSKRVTVK